MRSSRGVLLAGCVVAALLSGCAAARVFQPEAAELPFDEGALACENLNHQRPNITSFRSSAESTVTAGGESISFRYVIVSREPDSLRIDLLPTEGAFTLGLLVAQGGVTRVLNAQEKTFIESRDSSALIERFLGIRGFSPALVEAVVTGIPPELDCSRVAIFRENGGGLTVLSERDRVAFTIAEDTGRLTSFEVLAADSNDVIVTGSLYYSGGQGPSSMSLSIYEPHEAQGILLFKKVSLNPEISDEVFSVRVPDTYTRED
jgi:outer membrane lipoprotein-sorting protein